MKIVKAIKKIIRKFGIDIVKYNKASHPQAKILHLFKKLNVNKILDIGANTGQYAHDLRYIGFKGEIISFEPLSSAYTILSKAAQKDSEWQTRNCAIGNECGKATINISGNSESSSLQKMLDSHQDAAPESKYIGTETIDLVTLDSIFEEIENDGDNIYLKIDTQGFERNVLDGAKNSLAKVVGVQLEMSLIPLYENELLIEEMIAHMRDLGFILAATEHVYSHPRTAQTLQIDGVFIRKDLLM